MKLHFLYFSNFSSNKLINIEIKEINVEYIDSENVSVLVIFEDNRENLDLSALFPIQEIAPESKEDLISYLKQRQLVLQIKGDTITAINFQR